MTTHIHPSARLILSFEKHLEKVFPIFWWNSESRVSDPYIDSYLVVRVVHHELVDWNDDFVSLLRKLDRILYQIYQDLLHSQLVDHHTEQAISAILHSSVG